VLKADWLQFGRVSIMQSLDRQESDASITLL